MANTQKHDHKQDGKVSKCYIEQDSMIDDMPTVKRGGKRYERTTPNSDAEADANIDACHNANKGRVNLRALGIEGD